MNILIKNSTIDRDSGSIKAMENMIHEKSYTLEFDPRAMFLMLSANTAFNLHITITIRHNGTNSKSK